MKYKTTGQQIHPNCEYNMHNGNIIDNEICTNEQTIVFCNMDMFNNII